MTSITLTDDIVLEQLRMHKLQVFNWGTFSGLHDIPIAKDGFLFVGPSGSGKSTLLDAFSALLIPPRWADYNAAARESERIGRDRNLVTYIRGAWKTDQDDESGEIATQYLRTGPTWSALALTFSNGLGQTVVLVQLFWLYGKMNNTNDVNRWYFIFERPFDLREMQDFELDIRKLKQAFPDDFIRNEFSVYCERFRRLLGIESDLALKLLAKTQSAKNLGELNTFLRDFMLDKPQTFEAAERLVTEFSELEEAYRAVVTAREQVDVLRPARESHEQLQSLLLTKTQLDELHIGVDGYKEMCRETLLEDYIINLKKEAREFELKEQSSKTILDNQKSILSDLQRQHTEMGGGKIDQWESEKLELERKRDERLRKHLQVKSACEKLGWPLPETADDYLKILAIAREEIEDWSEKRKNIQQKQFELDRQKTILDNQFTEVVSEVKALRRQRSSIPANMLDLRTHIAKAVGLDDSSLPFVGELIEVRPEEASWRGAIERLLHGFALSILVDEQFYPIVSEFVNNTDLRRLLVYHRMDMSEVLRPRQVGSNSSFHKLKLQETSYTNWLETELKNRFDYQCVDSMQAFRNANKAVTITGQVRNAARHEKNDRSPVNDPMKWVLGFDNRDKLALFEQKAQQLAEEINNLNNKLNALNEEDNQQGERLLSCKTLADTQWQEIDVATVLEQITNIQKALRAARQENIALEDMAEQIKKQANIVEKSEKILLNVRNELFATNKEVQNKEATLQTLHQSAIIKSVTAYQREGLMKRFAALEQPLTLESIDSLAKVVERDLNRELQLLAEDRQQLVRAVEDRFSEFKRRWALEASDFDTSIDSALDFLAMLERLEADNLPAYEDRFFELLQKQTRQNLAALSQYLTMERKMIHDRMAIVNESLRQAPFNQGTYLKIKTEDRQLPIVREFLQEIRDALSHSLLEDRETEEVHFLMISNIVKRLASKETEHRNWSELVLDVRQHVEFIGVELNKEDKMVDMYRSGAGKSGGQREKLTTHVLAAALRYQLSGDSNSIPMYAPVVLDEAFSKADNEFTAAAMTVFKTFGFQMIVATPMKSVKTLEPFIGGACFVYISDRCRSSILPIEYDNEEQCLNLKEQISDETLAAIS